MKKLRFNLLLIFSFVAFSGCGKSPEEKRAEERALELEHARQMAEIEFEKQRRLQELEKENIRKEQQAALAKQQAYERSALGQRINAVKKLYFQSRKSLMDESETVLIVRNPSSLSLDVQLVCKRSGGYTKTLSISIPANGREEIGALEGWSFRPGDSFKISYKGTVYHSMVFNR